MREKNPSIVLSKTSIVLSKNSESFARLLTYKTIKFSLFVCFINVVFPSISFGQNEKKVDSLEMIFQNPVVEDSLRFQAIYNLIELHLYNDQSKAKSYISEIEQLVNKTNNPRGIAFHHHYQGVVKSLTDQLDSAEIHYQLALAQFEALNDKRFQSKEQFNLGLINYQRGHYKKALEILHKNLTFIKRVLGENHKDVAITQGLIGLNYHFQGQKQIALKNFLASLKIHEQHGDEIRKADMLHYIALIELDLGNYEKAIEYNLEAKKIFKAHDDLYFEGQVTNNLGLTYLEKADYNQAEKYIKQSIEKAKQMDNQANISSGYLNLSKIAHHKQQFGQAIELQNKALLIGENLGATRLKIEALNGLGKTYTTMNNAVKAISFLNQSIQLADSIDAEGHLQTAYLNRSIALEKSGKLSLALKDFKQYKTLQDTLLNKTKIQQIEELRIIHDLDKKEQSIALQKNQIELLEKEATVNKLQKWLLGLGLGLNCIIFGLTYYGVRQKLKHNQLQKEQQKLLYENELAFKKRALTAHALHLAKKNEVLSNLKQKAISLKATEKESFGYQKLINTIDFDLKDEDNWENFKKYFEQIHTDFNTQVLEKYPKVTANELRLMALLKMNLSSKEIANILNISGEGVKKARQRLRKKLGLTPADSLEGMILEF